MQQSNLGQAKIGLNGLREGKLRLGFSTDLHKRRLALHAAGLTDEEMAVKESTTRAAIVHWRNRANLKMNMKPMRKKHEDPCAIGAGKKITGRRCGNCAHYLKNITCNLCGNKAERPQWKRAENVKRS